MEFCCCWAENEARSYPAAVLRYGSNDRAFPYGQLFWGSTFCSKWYRRNSSHFSAQKDFHAGIETCRQMQAENEAHTYLAAVLRYGSGDKDSAIASFFGSHFCSKVGAIFPSHFAAQKHH